MKRLAVQGGTINAVTQLFDLTLELLQALDRNQLGARRKFGYFLLGILKLDLKLGHTVA